MQFEVAVILAHAEALALFVESFRRNNHFRFHCPAALHSQCNLFDSFPQVNPLSERVPFVGLPVRLLGVVVVLQPEEAVLMRQCHKGCRKLRAKRRYVRPAAELPGLLLRHAAGRGASADSKHVLHLLCVIFLRPPEDEALGDALAAQLVNLNHLAEGDQPDEGILGQQGEGHLKGLFERTQLILVHAGVDHVEEDRRQSWGPEKIFTGISQLKFNREENSSFIDPTTSKPQSHLSSGIFIISRPKFSSKKIIIRKSMYIGLLDINQNISAEEPIFEL